jgi:competence protein ComEA
MDRASLLGRLDRLRELARVSPGEVALAGLLAAVVVAGSFVVSGRTKAPPAPALKIEHVASSEATPSPSAPPLLVHVAGKVVAPGVYALPTGSRVRDAVAAAGGPAPGADPNALNLAAPVADGEQVVVPAVGEAPPALPGPSGPLAGGSGGPVGKTNLNTATQAQLEELPGVGPKLAQRLLAYRQRKGRFKSTRDLLEVEGFGPKKLAALEEQVTVG